MMATEERAGVQEQYETAATGHSNPVGAAGMSQKAYVWNANRLGLALMRLHSEWEATPKPKRPTREQMAARVASIKAADDQERQRREAANGELERLQGVLANTAEDAPERWDLLIAVMEQRRLWQTKALPLPAFVPSESQHHRAQLESQRWYVNELRLLSNRLKSKPAVLEQLNLWAADKGIDAAIVGQALMFWLDSTCHHCDGHGVRKVPDQPALSARRCHHCNGGTMFPPEGAGRVLGHIDYVLGVARGSLKQRLRNTR